MRKGLQEVIRQETDDLFAWKGQIRMAHVRDEPERETADKTGAGITLKRWRRKPKNTPCCVSDEQKDRKPSRFAHSFILYLQVDWNEWGQNMKKAIAFLFIMTVFCCLIGCGKSVVSEFTIDYGNSMIYSIEDMDAAIKLIENEFSAWKGCELHSITYSTDDECNSENIEWMNGLASGRGLAGNFTQCMMFKSDFHSPKNGGGAWNADAEYTGWQWWLARVDGGEWHLLTYGY